MNPFLDFVERPCSAAAGSGADGPEQPLPIPRYAASLGGSDMSLDSIDRYTWSQQSMNPFMDSSPWLTAPAVAQPMPPPTGAAPLAARPYVNVVLPAFRPTRPAAWFAAIEDIFRLRGVTDQRDQFAYAYAKLEEEQMQQVDDILEMRPLPPDAFTRLRDRLVSTHSLDAYQRLELLLALPALGGQRPTAMLAQLLQLCPPGEESTLFFRSAFLQRLPAGVRMQLAEDRHSPVQALATRADALIVHHQASTVAPLHLDGDTDSVNAVAGGKRPAKKVPAKAQAAAAKPTGGQKPWEKMGICHYHFRFGASAKRCEAPCGFPAEN